MAIDFPDTGSQEYVACGTGPTSQGGDVSVVFWMKADTIQYQIPVDKLPQSGETGWTVKLRNNGDIWFRIGAESGGHHTLVSSGGTAYSIGEWVCFVCRFNNSTKAMHIFKNGAQIAGPLTATGRVMNSPSIPFWIGCSSTAVTGEKFNGIIAEVRLYDRPLTLNEIASIATMNGADGVVSGRIGGWRMIEEAPGTAPSGADSVKDSSGRYDGTPGGTSSYSESAHLNRRKRRAA